MWFLTFAGEPRGFATRGPIRRTSTLTTKSTRWTPMATGIGHDSNPAAHAHESEPVMTWPLIILAVCAILSGWTFWVGLPVATPALEQMLAYGEPPGVIDAPLGPIGTPWAARWSSPRWVSAWVRFTTHRRRRACRISWRPGSAPGRPQSGLASCTTCLSTSGILMIFTGLCSCDPAWHLWLLCSG